MDNNAVPRCYRGYHRFEWYLNDPLLRHPVEAIFCFRLPFQTKWIARLERTGEARTATSLPVAFSLQYVPASENVDIELRANLSVNISNFAGVREPPWLMEPHSFNIGNHFTYRIVSSIGPDDFDIAIVVYLSIRNQGRILGEFDFEDNFYDLSNIKKFLSRHLRQLLNNPLYSDVLLLSTDPDSSYLTHSCILDARCPQLFAELQNPPNQDNPPPLVADIYPEILPDILTYLYSGCINDFNWLNRPSNDKYKTELFRVMDKYQLHHLHLILQPEVRVHRRNTRFFVFGIFKIIYILSHGMTRTHNWRHTLFDGVDVDIYLTFFLGRNEDPSFSYWLRFTNASDFYVRVSLEYIRRVGLEPEVKELVHERYWEVPDNGEVGPTLEIPMQGDIEHLRELIAGGDRVERGQEVRHSCRFVVLLSAGLESIEITQNSDNKFDSKKESFEVLSHHMSIMRYRMQDRADLHVTVVDPDTGNTTGTYHLHKAIFEVRVPNWRNVIQQDVPEGSNLPDSVSCATMNDAFRVAVHYIYTERRLFATADSTFAVIDLARRGGITKLELIMSLHYYELVRNLRREPYFAEVRM